MVRGRQIDICVLCSSIVQAVMADLEKDIRKMMLPNTALNLRVRRGPGKEGEAGAGCSRDIQRRVAFTLRRTSAR